MELVTVGLAPPGHPPLPDPFEVDAADEGAVDGPVMAEVKLAVTRGKLVHPQNLNIILNQTFRACKAVSAESSTSR